MTTAQQWLDLAERIEAATGADRELDALIWCALRGVRYASHNPADASFGAHNPETQVEFTEPPKRVRLVSGPYGIPHAKPFTASIDAAMTLGYKHPVGPLRLTDIVGLDVRLDIADYLAAELGPRFEPPALLRRMVADGLLGRKSGRGFYTYG